MQRFKCIVEYCGTNYFGMQKQNNLKTIQGEIELALSKLFQKNIEIYFSGRTDTGVHAIGQVIHFDVNTYLDAKKIKNALNFYLIKEEIAILNVELVNFDFHARFSSKERIYVYKIINRNEKLTFQVDNFLHVPQKMNIEKIKIAAKHLEGVHDFNAFRSSECQSKSSIKRINKIEIYEINNEINIYFYAKSFLHNMIRIIVGTLIEIGKEKADPSLIKEILESRDRKNAFKTVDACGLYFLKVIY